MPGFYEETILEARERLRDAHYRTVCQLIGDFERRGNSEGAHTWRRALTDRYPDRDAPSVRPAVPRDISRAQPPSTRFFGREQEAEAIRSWLAAGCSPILTLTGPAGIGKTRLAEETLRDVTFVALAELRSADRLYEAIQTALRLDAHSGHSAEENVLRCLRSAPTVLILDNFEQLVEAGAVQVARLLHAAPDTRLIITSRTRLEIEGERELVLSPLPPGESRSLFLERARAARTAFPDDPEDGDVDAICVLLEGIPLALELAAARGLALGPAQIRRQLADRFSFLVSRRRDIPERQRSLRAALEWSIQLLSPPLLESFLRCSVFRGGFTEEAASAVFASKHPAVDILETLRAHSLVLANFAQNQPARYDLLVSLRELGESLIPLPVRADARLRHARFFQSYVASCQKDVQNGLAHLDHDHENVLTALETLAEIDGDTCAGMTLTLCGHWEHTGRMATARAWLARCLSLMPADSAQRGPLLERYGALLMDFDHRVRVFEQGVTAYHDAGDWEGVARLEHALGSAAFAQGHAEEAQNRFAACLTLRRRLHEAGGEDSGLASTLHMLAVTSHRLHPEQDVAPLLNEAESRLRASGKTLGLAFVLSTRRRHAWERDDIAEARLRAEETEQCVEEATRMVAGHDDPPNHVFLWQYRGLVLTHQADFDRAFAPLCYARELYAGIGNTVSALQMLRHLANWHLLARGDARRAVRLWAMIDANLAAPFARLAPPERRWQEEYERQASARLGADEAGERAAGRLLTDETATALATIL
jgi:non-specific serine/threonine protein kinase